MPYAPGINDISGTLRAQGKIAQAQGIAGGMQEGYQAYAQNKARNAALTGQNEALLKAFSVDDETKKYAPEGIDKFIEKSIKGGGLSLNDSMTLNGMLNTALATKGHIQEQKLKAQEGAMREQQLKASQQVMVQQQRDQEALAKSLAQFMPPDDTAEAPAFDPARFLQIYSKSGGSPQSIERVDAVLKMLGPQGGGTSLVFPNRESLEAKFPAGQFEYQMVETPDGKVTIPSGKVSPRAPGKNTTVAAGAHLVTLDNEGNEIKRTPITPAAPVGYERTEAGGVRPISGSEQEKKVKADEKANINKKTDAKEHASLVMDTIDNIITEGKVGTGTAGVVGTVAGAIPGTAAYDLNSQLDTIRSIIGFDELRKMRDASPTGGALGQIAVRELEFLQAARGNLDRKQSPDQLRKNLEQIRESYKRWSEAVAQSDGDVVGAGERGGNAVEVEAKPSAAGAASDPAKRLDEIRKRRAELLQNSR